MASVIHSEIYTTQQYLEMEVCTGRKHEFYRGELFLMSGGSAAHSKIKINLYRLLGNILSGQLCTLYDADMRVKVAANGLYTYPDASIAFPPVDIETVGQTQTLTNPCVLFEVLAPSTTSYDRGAKFNLYCELPSLREYFLISQDRAVVERRTRVADGWRVTVVDGTKSRIRIESINYELQLAELYEKTDFPVLPSE